MRITWSSGDSPHQHRRSRGKRSDAPKRGRSDSRGSRRNPLTAPETAGETSSRRQRDLLAPIGEELAEAGRTGHSARRRRKPHTDAADNKAPVRKSPVGLTHIMFLLVGLALGAILLLSMNHLYSLMGKKNEEAPPPEPLASAQPLPPPPPAAIPAQAVQQATEPTQALKLMLAAAAKGDLATAYAQWDVGPEDVVTVKRGQEMTLADVVAKAQASGAPLKNQQLRVISSNGTEAKIGQFQRGLCLQVFSLRKQGPYWKLYNASAP
ncbi:MAG: hypothetical protein ACM3VW_04930 [Bacteroidota bacterium]